MKRTIPYITLFLSLIFSCCISFSQSVSVRATVNRDKILIGEPIELKLEASMPLNTDAKWFVTDSLSHFEFVDKGKIDTSANGDVKTYRQTLTITSFDSGRWAVPSLPLEIGNRQYLTDSIPVSVAYINFDAAQDYHDIKDILEVKPVNTKYINWILAGLALISLLVIIYFLRKKKAVEQVVVKQVVSNLTPLQEALQSLDQLHAKGLANGEVKVFYTQLSDILRRYVYRKTNVATLEKTSGELMLQVKKFNMPNEEFTLLAQAMRMGDAVKFAKFLPAAEDNEQSFRDVRKAIEQLDKTI
jgi:hypothetical protein